MRHGERKKRSKDVFTPTDNTNSRSIWILVAKTNGGNECLIRRSGISLLVAKMHEDAMDDAVEEDVDDHNSDVQSERSWMTMFKRRMRTRLK